MPKKPTIGRIVGFALPATHKREGQVVPAIVTRVENSTDISLHPFIDVSQDAPIPANLCGGVPYAPVPADGKATPRSWHWLPRDDEAPAASPAAPKS